MMMMMMIIIIIIYYIIVIIYKDVRNVPVTTAFSDFYDFTLCINECL